MSCLPTDRRVIAKVRELAQAGVRRIPQMQQLVREFVCSELFAGQTPPLHCDTRYWPTERVIRNCVYLMRKNRLRR